MNTTAPTTVPAFTLAVNNSKGQAATFYLQSKGHHSGRPLRQPIANCFAVQCDHPHAYEVAVIAYRAQAYRNHIRGSVIPFLIIADTYDILRAHLDRATPEKVQLLDQLRKLDALRVNLEQRAKLTGQMSQAIASQF